MSTPTKVNRRDVTDVPLDEAYFVWLYSQVGNVENKNRVQTYWKLLKLLYEREFTWNRHVKMDENRAQDGKELRKDFLRDTNTRVTEPDWMEMPCSVLEMLLALASKLEFQGGYSRQYWFWNHLIKNLGLIECNDSEILDEGVIHHILDKMIDRNYAENGAGGLFPLGSPQQDQRDVQLWYQAEAYLLERL